MIMVVSNKRSNISCQSINSLAKQLISKQDDKVIHFSGFHWEAGEEEEEAEQLEDLHIQKRDKDTWHVFECSSREKDTRSIFSYFRLSSCFSIRLDVIVC